MLQPMQTCPDRNCDFKSDIDACTDNVQWLVLYIREASEMLSELDLRLLDVFDGIRNNETQ